MRSIDLMIEIRLIVIDKLANCKVMEAVLILLPVNKNQLNPLTTAEKRITRSLSGMINISFQFYQYL